MFEEIELKLLIPAESAEWFSDIPEHFFGANPPQVATLVSHYFDTPDLWLRQQKMSLRVRATGAGWVQTLKSGGEAVDGLHRRFEYECEVQGMQIDLSRLDAPVAGALREKPLLNVFSTEFCRRAWWVEDDQGNAVELALDRGVVRAGSLEEAICEVEIELKQGSPAIIDNLYLRLASAVDLTPSSVSKAQRGYRLFQQGAACPA